MIEIKNITKKYGNANSLVIALDNVNLVIESGTFVGIIGESGSGKSTLLNLIGALDMPSDGSIFLDDIDITKFNENQAAEYRRNNLGFVFQNFYLEQDFNVLTNVEIPLMIQGIEKKKRSEIAKNTLQSLGLEDKIYCRIDELSTGQLQRVCIARALVNNTKLILADEPTGNLDTKNGRAVMELFKALTEKGITVIVVTHNIEQAKLCDKIICLSDGKVVSIE